MLLLKLKTVAFSALVDFWQILLVSLHFLASVKNLLDVRFCDPVPEHEVAEASKSQPAKAQA